MTRGNSVKLIFKVDYKINKALTIKTNITTRKMGSSAFEISITLLCYLCIENYGIAPRGYSVGAIPWTELPRFYGIKRYFKNSRNSPWIQILHRFPRIAPQYRIFHWITSFYRFFHGIAPFNSIYHAISRLYSCYHDNGVIPVFGAIP